MIVLDADHLVEYQKGTSAASQMLKQRLERASEPIAVTIISVEEIMRGWMAAIRRTNDTRRQVTSYGKLRQLFRFFATWNILDWDEAAATQFQSLRTSGVLVGTIDLKIASICVVHEATLLTRNNSDLARIPGLRLDDWLQ